MATQLADILAWIQVKVIYSLSKLARLGISLLDFLAESGHNKDSLQVTITIETGILAISQGTQMTKSNFIIFLQQSYYELCS